MMFWMLLILSIISVAGLFVFVGLWVYTDAKRRGNQPITWTLIALFIPNFMGLLLYLLMGRKTKVNGFTNKFKVPLIATALVFVISVSSFIFYIATAHEIPVFEGVSIGMITNNTGNEWNVSFKSSGEVLRRTIRFRDEQLNNLYVSANCEQGNMFLVVIQNDTVKAVNISKFEGRLDLNEFEPGKVRFMITNDSAKNASISMKWE
jgi:hypothetical protein